jgi:hypothetical protein
MATAAAKDASLTVPHAYLRTKPTAHRKGGWFSGSRWLLILGDLVLLFMHRVKVSYVADGSGCRDRGQLKCDGTRAETRFRLSSKRTNPFKSAGASVESATGSRGVSISGSNAGYTMLRGSVKSTGYPLHSPVSPSLSLPCVTVCHHISTGVYLHLQGQMRTHETELNSFSLASKDRCVLNGNKMAIW